MRHLEIRPTLPTAYFDTRLHLGYRVFDTALDSTIQIAEQHAHKDQSRLLKEHISAPVNTNMEIWADHEQEGRRLPHDIFSLPSLNLKRSDLEVKRYKALMEAVEESGNNAALLHELVYNWTTTINLEHVATLLTFSQEDVDQLISELNTGRLAEDSAAVFSNKLDKKSEWYPQFLAAVAEDDIVPLVMMRKLVLESKVTPSLRDLFIGLKRYLHMERDEMRQLADQPQINGINPAELARTKLTLLNQERDAVFVALRKMNRSEKRQPEI